MHSMTLEQLRAAAAAGDVAGVTLKGEGGAFLLRIATRSGQDVVLSKARSTEPRRFGNPASAMTPQRGERRSAGFATAHFSHINVRGRMRFGVEEVRHGADSAGAGPSHSVGFVTGPAAAFLELATCRPAELTTVVKPHKIPA